MKTLVLVIGCALAWCSVVPTRAVASEAVDAAAAKTFLVVFRPGPAWVEGQPVTAQPLAEHGRYLLDLYARGTMKMAGPFTDNSGGAVVLEAADEAAVEAIVAADPGVVTEVLVPEIHPWELKPWDVYLERREAAAAARAEQDAEAGR